MARFGKGNMSDAKRNNLIFYCIMFAFPVLQFLIFYVYVNINSILLAFKDYDPLGNTYTIVWFDNFVQVVKDLASKAEFIYALKNSLVSYLFSLLVGTTLTLFFSYYIYKQKLFHSGFKIILFAPSIISSVVIVILFTYSTEKLIPALAKLFTGKTMQGLLSNPKTTFGTLLFFQIWGGFGMGLLMYSGAMSSISESIIEAGKLDGVNFFQEFFNIIIPLIWPTLVTFVMMGVAGIFSNQLNLYSIYGKEAEFRLYTVGYYLYKETATASMTKFPYLSAMGLVFTIIVAPLALGVKKAMEKFGPSLD